LRGEGAEEELLADARKRRIWVEKIRFKVRNPAGMTLADVIATGKGHARLIFGNFTEFYQNVVDSMVQVGLRWNEAYGKVKRHMEAEEVELCPCTISYPSSFKPEHFKKLPSGLTRDYLLSVVHPGNPYFVADLCDSRDGSSFGLTILGDTVTISPMIKTTNTALWKLTARLQALLGEGQVTVAGVG
jgi:hypothetical protein